MRVNYRAGALPLPPRDLTPLRQNGSVASQLGATPPSPQRNRPSFADGETVRPPPLSFRPLSRRSGRIPALPYPPLRYFQSGSTATSPAMLLQRTAITPLTSCLTPGVHFTSSPPPTNRQNRASKIQQTPK